jgi:uncharacterized protein YjbI with pentapeptide repeats
MNQEELNETLEKHKLWIMSNGEKGKNTNLRKANLKYSDLYNAYLTGANLEEADLREADLRWANLIFANLYKANLEDADLRGADLTKADLTEANLQCLEIEGAIFKETKVCKKNYDYLTSLGVNKENLVLVLEEKIVFLMN